MTYIYFFQGTLTRTEVGGYGIEKTAKLFLKPLLGLLREASSILGLLSNLKTSNKEDTVDVDIGGGKVVKAQTYKGVVVGVIQSYKNGDHITRWDFPIIVSEWACILKIRDSIKNTIESMKVEIANPDRKQKKTNQHQVNIYSYIIQDKTGLLVLDSNKWSYLKAQAVKTGMNAIDGDQRLHIVTRQVIQPSSDHVYTTAASYIVRKVADSRVVELCSGCNTTCSTTSNVDFINHTCKTPGVFEKCVEEIQIPTLTVEKLFNSATQTLTGGSTGAQCSIEMVDQASMIVKAKESILQKRQLDVELMDLLTVLDSKEGQLESEEEIVMFM